MVKNEPISNETKEVIMDSVQSAIQGNEPLPQEVCEKLKQENIELEGDEKKLLELSYNISKKLEKQKLSSDELENIAGGGKFDDFMAKHPKLRKALEVLGIIQVILLPLQIAAKVYMKHSEKSKLAKLSPSDLKAYHDAKDFINYILYS